MIHGGYGVLSCDPLPSPCENLEFFLNLCLVLKQYITLEQYLTSLLFLLLSFIYYFRKYNGKHRNCLYTGGRPLPPPGSITMVEVNLKRKFSSGEWEKGAAIKDNVIIVEKVGIWPNVGKITCWKCGGGVRAPGICTLLNMKLQQKQKKGREKNYIHTANI